MFNPYKGDYKKLLAVPAVFFLVFLFLIFVSPTVPKGIDLSGGTVIRVSLDRQVEMLSLEQRLRQEFSLSDLQLSTTSGPLGFKVLVQFAENRDLAEAQSLLQQAKDQRASNPQNAVQLSRSSVQAISSYFSEPFPENAEAGRAIAFAEDALNKAKQNFSTRLDEVIKQELSLGAEARFSRDEVGPVFGESFYATGITVSLIAFALLAIVIFVFFREFVPSIAIIAAAAFDIAGSLAGMAVFRIPLSLTTIPALLMLIGYSVDTDIMLTTNVLKRREKELHERAGDSLVTGLTMTFTTIGALTVMLALSYFGQITVIFEISAVLLFGLFADLISTWLMNSPVLLWHAESRKARRPTA